MVTRSVLNLHSHLHKSFVSLTTKYIKTACLDFLLQVSSQGCFTGHTRLLTEIYFGLELDLPVWFAPEPCIKQISSEKESNCNFYVVMLNLIWPIRHTLSRFSVVWLCCTKNITVLKRILSYTVYLNTIWKVNNQQSIMREVKQIKRKDLSNLMGGCSWTLEIDKWNNIHNIAGPHNKRNNYATKLDIMWI